MDCSPLRLVSGLLHELVELDLRLRPFQSARVPHDLLVGVAVAIGLDGGFALPFRVRDEFGRVSAAQELFRKAALLLDHKRSALRLPDPHGVFGLGLIDLDVDEADDRHGVLLNGHDTEDVQDNAIFAATTRCCEALSQRRDICRKVRRFCPT